MPCEPLQVVDANIQITPATATNAVGTNHTLTCHINVNDGTGSVNAPDGTVCTVVDHLRAGHAGVAELHDRHTDAGHRQLRRGDHVGDGRDVGDPGERRT